MKDLSGPDILANIFVPELHKKFVKDTTSTPKFEALMKREGGSFLIDHGATRTPDPVVHKFITRLAATLGLVPNGHYEFPEKKLTAVDLQLPDLSGFKWFSTLVEYKKLSPEASKAIEDDLSRSNNTLSSKGMELLEKIEKSQTLSDSDAQAYVHEILHGFLHRQGKPVKAATYDTVSKDSSEAVNALLMGPDFNHIAYLLNALNIKDWFGVESIDVLYEFLVHEGFSMLPAIQGDVGSILRQTSTKADPLGFPLEDDNGNVTEVQHPAKFIEFIQRGASRTDDGKVLIENGKIKLFQGFLSANTVKIYDATSTKK